MVKKRLRLPEDISQEAREAIERAIMPPKPTRYERFCKRARRILGIKEYRLTKRSTDELMEAGLDLKGAEWISGMVLLLLLPIVPTTLTFTVLLALGGDLVGLLYLPMLGVVLAGLLVLVFQAYPSSLAASRKSEARGTAINTMMIFSFALLHDPDLRGATVYAGDMGRGKLAEDLRRALLEHDQKKRYETVRQALTKIANDWRKLDEPTRQAIFDILRSTGQGDETARVQDVMKAPKRMLDGAEEQLGGRLNKLVMPTMSFLVFSSLAIVAVIGLSPVFGMAGGQFIDLKFFILVVGVLITAFWAFTTYMLHKRPLTLPPPEIPSDDPRLPPRGKVMIAGKLLPAWMPPAVVFVIFAMPSFFMPIWLVWAVAASVFTHAYLKSSTLTKIREEERAKLDDWENAFSTLGSRVLDGKPMSQAMVETAELMEGSPLSEHLERTTRVMKSHSVDLHAAMFEYGAAKRMYNPLVKSFLVVITRIRRKSESAAGHACMMAANFLGMLRGVERRFRERMDEVLGNLWLVATVLLPVVCAMSVWVMGFFSGMNSAMAAQAGAIGASVPLFFGGLEPFELVVLEVLMGMATIVLSVIIARYIAYIRAGGDRMELWVCVGKATVLSAAVYSMTSVLLASLLGVAS